MEQSWQKHQEAWAREVLLAGENHLDARYILKVVPAGSAGELKLLLAFSTVGIQVPLAKTGNTRNSNCGGRENSIVGVTNFEMPSDISRDVELLLTVMWARILGKFGA